MCSDQMTWTFIQIKKLTILPNFPVWGFFLAWPFYIYTKYIMYVFWLAVVQMFTFAALNSWLKYSWLKQRKKWIDKTGKKWCASNILMHCHINYFAIQRKVITYTPKSSCSPSPRLNMFSSQTLNNDDINDVWSLVLGMTAKTCFMVLVKLSIPFSFPNIMSSWPNT